MWIYKNEELDEQNIPEKALGFVYTITHKPSGKVYIGKKLLTKAATRQVNGRKIKCRKPSDWKEYWSSSPTLKEWIAEEGIENFHREILTFCFSKSSLTYCEEMSMFVLGVLERPEKFINENIRSKMYRSWVKGKEEIAELRERLKTFD